MKQTYKGREVVVIQTAAKTGRKEVIWAEEYKPGIAGFWINASELIEDNTLT